MRRHAKASLAGSIEGNGNSRSLFRRAPAVRDAHSDAKGSGARLSRRAKSLLAVLALTTCVLALSADLASARDIEVSPVVTVSNVLGGSAHVSGEIDASGEAYWWFETSIDGGVNWSVNVFAEGKSFSQEMSPVEADLKGLKGSTKYLVRFVARNEVMGPIYTPGVEFETLPVAKPTVLSADDASPVFSTTAEVSGSVERPVSDDPGFDAQCSFEYVTDAAFQPKNEEQSLTVRATGGTFTLGFEAQTTAPIAFDASAASVQAALEALSSVGSGAVAVSGGPGDETGTAPYAIAFAGSLAAKNVEAISVDPAALTVEGEASAGVQIVAEGHPEGFNSPSQVPCEPKLITSAGPNPVTASLTGLAAATTYHLRLTATNAGGSDSKEANTFTTTPLPVVDPPTVLGAEVSEVGSTTAKASGSVERPAGADPLFNAECTFEYITAEKFTINEGNALPGFKGAVQVPCEPKLITDPGPTSVTASLTGLATGTTYHLRLAASNFGGANSLETSNFTTTPVIVVQTLGVGSLQATSASLAGRINPDKAAVAYQFEWGEVSGPDDETYENVAPAIAEPLDGADKSFHIATAPLTSLLPEGTYHYRVVATNTQTNEKFKGQDRIFTTLPTALPPAPCPNETSRVGRSASLPDCRAYELVTPNLNNAYLTSQPKGRTLADGSALLFQTIDAPDDAESSPSPAQQVISRRTAGGWSAKSVEAPTPAPVGGYGKILTMGVSPDMTQSSVYTDQPLAGPGSPSDLNFYLRRADGSFVPITSVGASSKTTFRPGDGLSGFSRDFTHLYYRPCVKQIESDPIGTCPGNTYEWSGGEPKLLGVLPGGTPAPGEATLAAGVLPAVSGNGEYALFQASGDNALYLRVGGEQTIKVSTSQRTIDPDPDPDGGVTSVGITDDGSKVLFVGRSELTNDANTGDTEGVANHQGADLYSYDVQSKVLTDLTVDDNPSDSATGANVQGVLSVSRDGSYVYFVAGGVLAPGALSGERSLYVAHNGAIDFIAPAGESSFGGVYATPDGLHAAVLSRESLTGYDNVNPGTGLPEVEVFKYTYGGRLECASCRPSGLPPTGSAGIVGRAVSDDGNRVFFQSTDSVVPQVSNGLPNIFEYERGEVYALTPGDGNTRAVLLDASASGDDIFFSTYEELTTQGQGTVNSVYDAHVNGDTARPIAPACQGENCRGPATTPPGASSVGSGTFSAPTGVAGPKSKTVRAPKAQLRLAVPEGGLLSVSGKGLKPAKKKISKAGTAMIALALNPSANASRLSKGSFKTRARVLFKSSSGETSVIEVPMTFQAVTKKGGK